MFFKRKVTIYTCAKINKIGGARKLKGARKLIFKGCAKIKGGKIKGIKVVGINFLFLLNTFVRDIFICLHSRRQVWKTTV